MFWNEDTLKTMQPYFVFETEHFFQEVYLRQGISHFYTCRLSETKAVPVVPDGCVDLFFEYFDGNMEAFACGTVLKCDKMTLKGNREIFGVRFFPGYKPKGLKIPLRELLANKIPLGEVFDAEKMLFLLKDEMDFYQRIRIFLQEYTKIEKLESKPFGKNALVMNVRNMVYAADGIIKISQISEKTGYSERYIDKVFLEEMGYSPKIFCKIVQFQRALEFLNYGNIGNMTEAAVNLGYYDQSQFIRDFKNYVGLTPKQYLKMVEEKKYSQRVKNVKYEM